MLDDISDAQLHRLERIFSFILLTVLALVALTVALLNQCVAVYWPWPPWTIGPVTEPILTKLLPAVFIAMVFSIPDFEDTITIHKHPYAMGIWLGLNYGLFERFNALRTGQEFHWFWFFLVAMHTATGLFIAGSHLDRRKPHWKLLYIIPAAMFFHLLVNLIGFLLR